MIKRYGCGICIITIIGLLFQSCSPMRVVTEGNQSQLEKYLTENKEIKKEVLFHERSKMETEEIRIISEDSLAIADKTFAMRQIHKIKARKISIFSPLLFISGSVGVAFIDLPKPECVTSACVGTALAWYYSNIALKVLIGSTTLVGIGVIESNNPEKIFIVTTERERIESKRIE